MLSFEAQDLIFFGAKHIEINTYDLHVRFKRFKVSKKTRQISEVCKKKKTVLQNKTGG